MYYKPLSLPKALIEYSGRYIIVVGKRYPAVESAHQREVCMLLRVETGAVSVQKKMSCMLYICGPNLRLQVAADGYCFRQQPSRAQQRPSPSDR